MTDPAATQESLANLGQLLVDRKALTSEALARALANLAAGATEDGFLDALIESGDSTEGAIVAVLAERSGFPGIDLSKSAFLLSVLDLIPRPVAEHDSLLPLSTEGGRLHIAVTAPTEVKDSIDEVRFITGMDISLYIALSGPLQRCIATAFDAREKGESVWRGSGVGSDASPKLASLQPSPVGPETHAADVRAASSPGLPRVEAGAAEPAAAVETAPVPVVEPQAEEEEILEGELIEAELVEEEPDAEVSMTATPIESARIVPAPPVPQSKPPPIEIEVGDDGGEEEEELVVSVHTGPKRILVVDDEPDIIRLCTRALVLKGYVVESAADGALAEARLKKQPPPDLVLLDAMLPLVHGFEICQRIKSSKQLRSVPVIMMSAVYRGWRFAQDAKETYGADDFIEKPFHVADMLRRVDERLAEGPPEPPKPKQSTEKLYRQGVELLAAGKAQEGRKALEQAAREDPFSPRIQFALGGALAAVGDTYRAITAYERAVELRPKLFPALRNLAGLYLEKGFRQKAHETLERADACAPDPKAREEIRTQLARLV